MSREMNWNKKYEIEHMYLFFLKNGTQFKVCDIADYFGISVSTLYNILGKLRTKLRDGTYNKKWY